jgi:hypothetical protein
MLDREPEAIVSCGPRTSALTLKPPKTVSSRPIGPFDCPFDRTTNPLEAGPHGTGRSAHTQM